MKYLIVPALDTLTKQMRKCDLGDFIINGRIEAYSCKRAGQDKRTAKSLEKQLKTLASSPKVAPSSPLGPLALPSTRKLLISLITTMNSCFPDYDFSDLRPEQFTETKAKDVLESLNGLFIDAMDTTVKGFRSTFWKTVDEVIQIDKCQIFTYKPGFGSSKALWATNFFFYNKKLKKIVFLFASATSKLALATGKVEEDLSDAEVEMEEDEGAEEEGADAHGYVDVDLLDMDDLGLDTIDMPESKWIPAEEFSLGSLASFSTDSTRQDSQSTEISSTSRSLFDSQTASSSTSSIFSSSVATS